MNLYDTNRPLIMGILNLTPDSFSDGGQYTDAEVALQHAEDMVEQGADIIDIGGESTRPDANTVSVSAQIDRVIPVLAQLRATLPDNIPISIDTTSSIVAKSALEAGASIINDVSAAREDSEMFNLAAKSRIPIILMHMQGTPATMQQDPCYDNVVEEIKEFLLQRATAAEAAGVDASNIILDPGIGFGKTKQHNLEIMADLKRFTEMDYDVVLGASRKRFMGSICEIEKYEELVGATCSTTVLGVLAGVKIFRVHDVKENRQAADVGMAIKDLMSVDD